jgi:hypothetical protein
LAPTIPALGTTVAAEAVAATTGANRLI